MAAAPPDGIHKTPSASPSASQSPPLTPTPVRKRRLPSGTDKPKSILKPAPPPQKAFSFRRDILQSLNSRLAQQGVNVQVPLPNAAAAQGAANLLGGMFKRIGGIAGAALAGQPIPDERQANNDSATSGPSPAAVSLQNVAARAQTTGPSPGQHAQPPLSPPSTATDSITATSGLPPPSSSPAPLKRVLFTVSNMSVIYPMGTGPPADEDQTRKRIERLHRSAIRTRKPQDWTPRDLEILYRECCRTREEQCLKKMRLIFAEAAQQTPPALKSLDLSFLPLDRQAIDPIADLLSVDFGLSKLVLENCGLTDDGLKAILHALLVSGTLPNLSIASNRKIRYAGWTYVAVFMRRARALKYLDLSENSFNRASMEHIVDAIRKPVAHVTRSSPAEDLSRRKSSNGAAAGSQLDTAGDGTSSPRGDPSLLDVNEDDEPLMPPASLLRHVADEDKVPLTSAIISLRLENCAIRGRLLSLLAPAIRFSDLKHLSLRRNRINQIGAVGLAIMLKDYPDASAAASEVDGLTAPSPDLNGGDQGATHGDAPVPIITSSPAGGMIARRMPPAHEGSPPPPQTKTPAQSEAEADALALALARAKKAKRILGTMPRIGSLLTLDLKSNDIRGGVNYLAQVLRKNRTLRVLNLSDNGIDMQGLVAIAEALKYNSTLETLDLSHNPCSGPGLEGITTLRQAFTLNSNLKRLFLNDTDLSSEGAIALAEFLPEARSLIHLDLTENFDIEIAGVMALAVSVRLNKSLRCLDLNIPPNDPDFARLSQEILQSCIRNTEAAQKKAEQRGITQPVAAPIYKSVVARAAKEKSERERAIDATRRAEEQASAALANGQAAMAHQSHEKLLEAAQTCLGVLKDLLESEKTRQEEHASHKGGDDAPPPLEPPPGDFVRDLVAQSNRLRTKLGRAVSGMADGGMLERALRVNDELDGVTSSLVALYRETVSRRRQSDAEQQGQQAQQAASAASAATTTTLSPRAASKARAVDPEDRVRVSTNGRAATGHAGQSAGVTSMTPSTSADSLSAPVIDSSLSSPSFSIGSDEEDEDEEDDEKARRDTTSSVLQGLRIDTSEGVAEESQTPAAEKEDAPPVSPTSPRGEVETKARSMVDEEGEIFRRARSLQAEEEEEEEEERGQAEQTQSQSHSQSQPQPQHRQRRSSSSSSNSSSSLSRTRSKDSPSSSEADAAHESSTTSEVDIADEDTSGDELRRRLLAADLPRAEGKDGRGGEGSEVGAEA